MIRLISYNSCDSVLERDFTVLDCKLIKLSHNQCLNDNQKNVCNNPLSENLLKLLYSKFLLNYQNRLMNNTSRSGSYHNCSQIRTEYYNDFDDCLRDYKNHKLKLQKQSKVQPGPDTNKDQSDDEYVDAQQLDDTLDVSASRSYKSTPSPTLTSPTTSQRVLSSSSPTNLTIFTSPLSTRQDVSSRRLSSDSSSTIFASPPSTSRRSPINQEIILDPSAFRDMSSPSYSQQWLASPPSHKSSHSTSSAGKKHHRTSKSPLSKSHHKHSATPSPPSKKSTSVKDATGSINQGNIRYDNLPNNWHGMDITEATNLMATATKKTPQQQQQSNLFKIVSLNVNDKTIDKLIMNTTSSSNKSGSHENIINNGNINCKQPTKAEMPTNKNDINENARKIAEKATTITITTPTTQKKTGNGDTTRSKMTVTCTGTGTDNKINNLEDASWGLEREVTLERELNKSFGISIVGGKVNVSKDSLVSGIFIKSIIPTSPADKSAQLKVGDRILAVDGNDIRNSSHEMAVKTIKNAGGKMTLIVQSLNTGMDNQTSIDFIKKLPPPVTPTRTPIPELIQEGVNSESAEKAEQDDKLVELDKDKHTSEKKKTEMSNGVSSNNNLTVGMMTDMDDDRSTGRTPLPDTESEGSSDEEDTRELEGRTYTAAGAEIDRASAGNVKRTKEEIAADPEKEDEYGYTNNKIKKRYGALGQVLCHTIDKGTSTNIGISLAGHRDRNKMACFIAGINPKGLASNTQLEIGDEILEVNGIVLHGRCHLNASAIIKGLPGPTLQLIVLRRKQAVEDLAVKPVTQFPVEISNEDAFASFKNVRNVTIKKGNQSLGIMIIEGKHAEVGQGIFVSDIQEGSNAEKAGLNIGDMILAVNKDSLLGCSYETAASMLKKTEGIVVLTVCNPNKKDKEKENEKDGSIKKDNESTKGPSRPITPKPQPSPAKEIAADPFTVEIRTNENTAIEIKLDNQPIGIQVVGGCDNLVNTGAAIVNILPDSMACKDKRLQVFDQILEINSTKITPELTSEQIQRAIKQVQSKVKLIVYRADPSEVENIDIELMKKPGKYFGLGLYVGNPKGIYITDIIPGGLVEADGRIQKSDIVTHVNSESISNMTLDECSSLLKTIQGKIILRILRVKPKKRLLN